MFISLQGVSTMRAAKRTDSAACWSIVQSSSLSEPLFIMNSVVTVHSLVSKLSDFLEYCGKALATAKLDAKTSFLSQTILQGIKWVLFQKWDISVFLTTTDWSAFNGRMFLLIAWDWEDVLWRLHFEGRGIRVTAFKYKGQGSLFDWRILSAAL